MDKPSSVGPCPACGDPRTRTAGLKTEDRYQLLRCIRCRSQFFVDCSKQASDSQSHYKWESYKLAVYKDEAVREGFASRYAGLLSHARSEQGGLSSVLDIGCGIGNFLDFAQHHGLRAVGSDVSPRAVAEARARGLEAYLADELDTAVADNSFDALTLWDVIEHVEAPEALLLAVMPKLRRGGVLLFETPDGGFPVRTLLLALHKYSYGRFNLTQPMYYWEHKVYLTESGMRELLDRVGADVVYVERATSVRAKMQREFAVRTSKKGKLLRITWPVLEYVFRKAGWGNKLLVVARRRT